MVYTFKVAKAYLLLLNKVVDGEINGEFVKDVFGGTGHGNGASGLRKKRKANRGNWVRQPEIIFFHIQLTTTKF